MSGLDEARENVEHFQKLLAKSDCDLAEAIRLIMTVQPHIDEWNFPITLKSDIDAFLKKHDQFVKDNQI